MFFFFFLSVLVPEVEGQRRKGKREREREREIVKKNKKEYLNKLGKEIEFWDVGCIEKWYGIIDKVAFWDGKIG